MKRVIGLVLVACLSFGSVACKSPLQTLAASVAGLQSAVIADGISGGISGGDEGQILKVLTQLEMAIAAEATGGPKAAVQSAWSSGLEDLSASVKAKYKIAIDAISAAIADL